MLSFISPLLYLSAGVYVGIWIAQNHNTPPLESPVSLVMRVKQWITGESSISDCTGDNSSNKKDEKEPQAKKQQPQSPLDLLAKSSLDSAMKSFLDVTVGSGDNLI